MACKHLRSGHGGGKIIGSEVEAITDENGSRIIHDVYQRQIQPYFITSWLTKWRHQNICTLSTLHRIPMVCRYSAWKRPDSSNIHHNHSNCQRRWAYQHHLQWRIKDHFSHCKCLEKRMMRTTTQRWWILQQHSETQTQFSFSYWLLSGADENLRAVYLHRPLELLREWYYHTFPGPWFDLGASVLYLHLDLLINSHPLRRHFTIHQQLCMLFRNFCFVWRIYWAFGWFFQIGQPVAAFRWHVQ